jgi:hypothetical protein
MKTFGVKTVLGFGHRGNKTDHDDGLALDFMTYADRAKGNKIAAWFRANRAIHGVTYIIFNGRIASARNGWAWRPYRHPAGRSDATAMHRDHVHVSFGAQARPGGTVPRAAAGSWQSTLSPAERWILTKESSLRPTADNPTSTAFGLGQLLYANRVYYGRKLGISPNTRDPFQQLRMFRAYVRDRYGTAEKALAFWQRNGWY